MVLEPKIGTHNNLNRLCLCSHFQRYSYRCMEDIYTKLVKSSVCRYILISTHLYLLVRDDSRAEISREEHGHIYVRAYKFSGAFVPMHRRYAYASDHKTLDFPSFSVYFPPLLQLCLPLTNKIAQKWPTTSHRRWCYTSWNALIFRTDTQSHLFYIITNFHMIWYTSWCSLIILTRNAHT